jgi:hypothetical protein
LRLCVADGVGEPVDVALGELVDDGLVGEGDVDVPDAEPDGPGAGGFSASSSLIISAAAFMRSGSR